MFSLLWYVIVLTYLCMQLLDVFSYKDPQINSYKIKEDRKYMTEPLYFKENKLQFFFGFQSPDYKMMPLDPRLGRFELTQVSGDYTDFQKGDNFDEFQKITEVPLNEINFLTRQPMAKTGLYTFGDEKDLKVRGGISSLVKDGVYLDLIPC